MVTSVRTRCLLLGFMSSLGLMVGVAISMASLTGSDVAAEVQKSSRELTLPNSELSPDEVVQLQTGALREFRHDHMALLQCYCLASPANRIVTGPLNRFGAMVRQQQYEALIFADYTLVGRPVVRGSQAAVLVTVVDANRRASVFRFILSKQQGEPFDGCWMTDAVTPDVSSIPTHSHEPLAARGSSSA